MTLGEILAALEDDGNASAALDALGDIVLLARVQTLSANYNETPGEFVSASVRRFAASASDEDWLALMGAIGRDADPAKAALQQMLNWALAIDGAKNAACGQSPCTCANPEGAAMVMRPPSDVLAATELAAWPQATSFALLDDPLAFIAAEHLRLRHVCAILRDFAEADCLNRSQAANVVEFLRSEFVLHHQDEEDSLFPVLARRLLPEDDLGAVLAHLRDDHRQLASITERIVAQLNALAVGGQIKLDDETRLLLIVCAESEQRHRAVEDGIVLAIARIRLAENDLDEISRSMKARRGVAN